MLSASYVGNQSHRLLVLVESNPGDPALCLSLSQTTEVAPGSATCGPFGESNVFTTASGQTVNGTRGPLGPNFGSNTNQSTIGNSNYNALELSLRHTSKGLQLFASYTYSKSIDQSSNVGEEVNPIDPALSRALSAFDVTQNFVVSYAYELPFERLFRRFQSLDKRLDDFRHHPFQQRLSRHAAQLRRQFSARGRAQRHQQLWRGRTAIHSGIAQSESQSAQRTIVFQYSPSLVQRLQPLGTAGQCQSPFFLRARIDNYDMALLKSVRSTESKSLQFRFEGFNVFNHAQFYGPASVNGNINSSSFGQVVSAAPPRLMQAAVKFIF